MLTAAQTLTKLHIFNLNVLSYNKILQFVACISYDVCFRMQHDGLFLKNRNAIKAFFPYDFYMNPAINLFSYQILQKAYHLFCNLLIFYGMHH